MFFFFQAEDGIRDDLVTGVQTCALPIYFAFNERFRNRCSVDRDEGSRGSLAEPVDGPGRELFAGPAFSGDDSRRIGGAERSEERRVGKECRSRWVVYQLKK